MVSHFFVPPQHASQCTLPKNDNTVRFMKDAMKILIERLVENFKTFEFTSILFDCWTAVRLTSTRSISPHFSHNKGNLVGFTKLSLRWRFCDPSSIHWSLTKTVKLRCQNSTCSNKHHAIHPCINTLSLAGLTNLCASHLYPCLIISACFKNYY